MVVMWGRGGGRSKGKPAIGDCKKRHGVLRNLHKKNGHARIPELEEGVLWDEMRISEKSATKHGESTTEVGLPGQILRSRFDILNPSNARGH